MKTIKDQIAVMQAYEMGKVVERKALSDNGKWVQVDTPTWDWAKFDYRVAIMLDPVDLITQTTFNKLRSIDAVGTVRFDYGKVIVSSKFIELMRSRPDDRLVIVCLGFQNDISEKTQKTGSKNKNVIPSYMTK